MWIKKPLRDHDGNDDRVRTNDLYFSKYLQCFCPFLESIMPGGSWPHDHPVAPRINFHFLGICGRSEWLFCHYAQCLELRRSNAVKCKCNEISLERNTRNQQMEMVSPRHHLTECVLPLLSDEFCFAFFSIWLATCAHTSTRTSTRCFECIELNDRRSTLHLSSHRNGRQLGVLLA